MNLQETNTPAHETQVPSSREGPMLDDQDLHTFRVCRRQELDSLSDQIASTTFLKETLDENWLEAVRKIISGMGPDHRYTDQRYHLFRIFRDQPDLVKKLDDAISTIEAKSRVTRRLRHCRETQHKLTSVQANQIQAAIFELFLLSRLIQLSATLGLNIEIYPTTQNGRNIEARVWIETRWCNFEAKALGYSSHDVGMNSEATNVGTHSIDSMIKQVNDALSDKAEQLTHTGHNELAFVLLALGFNADSHSGPWGIDEFFNSPKGSDLSAVLLYGSFLCRKHLGIFPNPHNRSPLTIEERLFLESFAKC